MKTKSWYKQLLSTISLVLLLFAVTIPTNASGIGNSKMSVNETNVETYTVNGMDVYSNPYIASTEFDVTELIYFTADPDNCQISIMNEANITVVTNMEDLIEAAVKKPFSAIVVDANATDAFDEAKIIKLAHSQHLVLIMGYNSPSVSDAQAFAENQKHLPKERRMSLDGSNFSAYYVDVNESKIKFWYPLHETALTVDVLVDFADKMKDDLFYVYEAITSPSANSEKMIVENNVVNDELLPDENLLLMSTNDWDMWENNQAKVFQNYGTIPSQLPMYTSYANGSQIMSIGVGEIVLFTGVEYTYNGYRWYHVRAWKTDGTLYEGWVRSFYSSGSVGPYCWNMEEYAANNADGSHLFTHSTRGGGYKLRNSAAIYDSSGTRIDTLPAGWTVWFTVEQAYAGASRPYLIAISGYTTNSTYYSLSSTTFVDANLETGEPTTYNICTRW